MLLLLLINYNSQVSSEARVTVLLIFYALCYIECNIHTLRELFSVKLYLNFDTLNLVLNFQGIFRYAFHHGEFIMKELSFEIYIPPTASSIVQKEIEEYHQSQIAVFVNMAVDYRRSSLIKSRKLSLQRSLIANLTHI